MSSGIQLDAKTMLKEVKGWVVLVRQDPVATESAGGIVFSENKQEMDKTGQTRGTVVSIGEFAWSDEPGPRAKVGDRILYRQHSGQILHEFQGTDTYRVINDKDVYAVLEPI